MRLSLRWCVTNYSESLYIFISLVNVRRKYQSLDWRLVNQRRRIIDCVFRFFYSSKYLTTLRSNISLCQKATTLILIPLCTPSLRLWKPSKKNLRVLSYFCLGCLLKSATVTSFSQLHLSRNSCSRRSLDQINLHFLALYTRRLIKKTEKCEKLPRFFVGKKNFYV